MKQQSTSAITSNLEISEILGDWNIADAMPDLINKVTSEQINKTLNKYILGLRWSYLGNADKANDASKSVTERIE